MKGLAGDKSDNIPGVTKIGEKTAIKLLTQFGSVEGVYEHIDELKPSKMKENLINDKEQALLSKKLATIDCQAPIEVTLEDTLYMGPDLEKLRSLYEELGFRQFLAELDNDETPQEKEEVAVSYELVTELTPEMFTEDMSFVLETLGDNYHLEDIVGVSWGKCDQLYVAKEVALLQEPLFKEWLEGDLHKGTYDVKKNKVLLHRYGIELNTSCDDVMIASYLLNTINQSDDLAAIATALGIYRVKTHEEIFGKGKKLAVPSEAVLENHLAQEVSAVSEMLPKLMTLLEEKNQRHLYDEIELPMAFILAKMEMEGVRVDSQTLKQIGLDLETRIKSLQDKIFAEAGEEFNLNSPKQLGVILFEKMGLPVIKKTKTGYSTSMDVLNKLRPDAPIVDVF